MRRFASVSPARPELGRLAASSAARCRRRARPRARRRSPRSRSEISAACVVGGHQETPSRPRRPRIPLTKPGASAPQYSLRDLDRLVDRDLGRDVVAVLDLVERDPHHVALERRDPVEVPALGVARDHGVELVPVGLDPERQLPRERAGVGEQVVERAPGDVALVAGEDGVAALVGPAHMCLFCRVEPATRARRTRRCGCRRGPIRPLR